MDKVKVARNWINDKCAWTNLKLIPSQRVVQSTYLWLLIVPIAVNLLTFGEELCESTLIDTNCAALFDFAIPFTWKWFYFAALIFTVANILFSFRCPHVVKLFDDSDDFEERGKSIHLFGGVKLPDSHLVAVGRFLPNREDRRWDPGFFEDEENRGVSDEFMQHCIDRSWPQHKRALFHDARESVDKASCKFRLVIGFLYFLGSVATLVVFVHTVLKTIEYMF